MSMMMDFVALPWAMMPDYLDLGFFSDYFRSLRS
jgi:hypothetical protein